ncbi:hypothetical protein DPEC_G00231200 [Dallia pectoralis]|uniref:Uncharacterized protein n=1 Tax=Dallia pectoralis TaxID=75939 RepID=A0ACC2FXB5_DALPE|nr:hypothetical protein DPEC_G00231200 [Dallia pectoralis]
MSVKFTSFLVALASRVNINPDGHKGLKISPPSVCLAWPPAAQLQFNYRLLMKLLSLAAGSSLPRLLCLLPDTQRVNKLFVSHLGCLPCGLTTWPSEPRRDAGRREMRLRQPSSEAVD